MFRFRLGSEARDAFCQRASSQLQKDLCVYGSRTLWRSTRSSSSVLEFWFGVKYPVLWSL